MLARRAAATQRVAKLTIRIANTSRLSMARDGLEVAFRARAEYSVRVKKDVFHALRHGSASDPDHHFMKRIAVGLFTVSAHSRSAISRFTLMRRLPGASFSPATLFTSFASPDDPNKLAWS